jgi:methylated-DNA-[protein]-cysteine S-methyltransferase
MARYVRKVETPVGELTLVAEDEALVAVHWPEEVVLEETRLPCAVLDAAAAQLAAYFEGQRRRFDVTLRPAGTAFQRRVWQALTEIDHGTTRTYADLARAIGRPTAARAVGAANGRNPLPIFIPCHRVVGGGGTLTGFSGGLAVKRQLLALEATASRSEPRAGGDEVGAVT